MKNETINYGNKPKLTKSKCNKIKTKLLIQERVNKDHHF